MWWDGRLCNIQNPVTYTWQLGHEPALEKPPKLLVFGLNLHSQCNREFTSHTLFQTKFTLWLIEWQWVLIYMHAVLSKDGCFLHNKCEYECRLNITTTLPLKYIKIQIEFSVTCKTFWPSKNYSVTMVQ